MVPLCSDQALTIPQGVKRYATPKFNEVDCTEEQQNYVVTKYSAELVNTLTNLLFMYLAIKGIHNCLKHGHDKVFLVAFIGYLLVGSGSFAFHATLKCTPHI